jgi:argininosuccinate lyase
LPGAFGLDHQLRHFIRLHRKSTVHPAIGADVFDALTLRGSMNARNVRGGTAPAQVRVQIERHLGRLTVAV